MKAVKLYFDNEEEMSICLHHLRHSLGLIPEKKGNFTKLVSKDKKTVVAPGKNLIFIEGEIVNQYVSLKTVDDDGFLSIRGVPPEDEFSEEDYRRLGEELGKAGELKLKAVLFKFSSGPVAVIPLEDANGLRSYMQKVLRAQGEEV